MKKIALVFYLLATAVSIFLCWFGYMAIMRPSMERKWIQVPVPSEPLILIRLNETGEILAEGETGNLYQFNSYPEPVWQKVNEPNTTFSTSVTCGPIEYSGYNSLPLKGKVKSHVSEACGFGEQTNYIEMSLLENGETWYLETSNNSYATIGLVLLFPLAIVIDLVLYVISLFFFLIDFLWKRMKP